MTGNGNGNRPLVEARLTTLQDVKPEHVTWRWERRLPLGKVVVVEGPPGLGKSTLTVAVCAAISAGRALPGGTAADPADCIILSYEDGIADTIAPRLLAAAGDARRVHVLEGVRVGKDPERPFTLPEDVEVLRSQIEATGARFVVIDPFGAALAGTHDSHRDQDVRRAIAPLAKAAEETGCTIAIVRHLRKGANGSAIDAGMGSVGIGGAARVVLSVHRHPEKPDQRVLAVVKNNLAPEAPSLVWHLVPSPEHGCGRVEWLGETDLRADALLAAQRDEADDESTGDERSDWLRAVLGDGSLPAREVLRLARQSGYAERSIQRTAKRLGVEIRREGSGRDHKALWSLASTPANTPTTSGVAQVARVEEGGASTPANLFTPATPATPDTLGGVARVPDDGVIHYPDGSQSLTPERIATMRAARAARTTGGT
jgi:hypothetical protein